MLSLFLAAAAVICATAAYAGPREDALALYSVTTKAEEAFMANIGSPRDLIPRKNELFDLAEGAKLTDDFEGCREAAKNLATAASTIAVAKREDARGNLQNYDEWLASCARALKVKRWPWPLVRQVLRTP